jgi:hypothetical protein
MTRPEWPFEPIKKPARRRNPNQTTLSGLGAEGHEARQEMNASKKPAHSQSSGHRALKRLIQAIPT